MAITKQRLFAGASVLTLAAMTITLPTQSAAAAGGSDTFNNQDLQTNLQPGVTTTFTGLPTDCLKKDETAHVTLKFSGIPGYIYMSKVARLNGGYNETEVGFSMHADFDLNIGPGIYGAKVDHEDANYDNIVTSFQRFEIKQCADTPATPATVSGSWSNGCKTISVNSTGWDPKYQVAVRWYGSATQATPGVDGEIKVPVNQPWSQTVDPNKVRGFSYRIVDEKGNFVTALKEEAAACIVVVPPSVTLAKKDCDTVQVEATGLPKNAYPGYVDIIDETGKVVKTLNAKSTGSGTYETSISEAVDVPNGHTYHAEAGMIDPSTGKKYKKATAADVAMTEACAVPVPPVAESGNQSTACNVHWVASTLMNMGFPDYSNTGYLQKLLHTGNDANTGIFEVQHWIDGRTINWRIPVGTKQAINDAKVTVKVPDGFNYKASVTNYDYVGSKYGADYPTLIDIPEDKLVLKDGVLTVDLGNLPAGSHTKGIMLTGTIPANMDPATDEFRLSADLTGSYAQGGAPSCPVVTPPTTDPGNPGGTTDPGNPGNPGGTTDPGNPGNPGNPGGTTNPGNPGGNTGNPGTPDNPKPPVVETKKEVVTYRDTETKVNCDGVFSRDVYTKVLRITRGSEVTEKFLSSQAGKWIKVHGLSKKELIDIGCICPPKQKPVKMVNRTFQVDRLMPKTAQQAKVVASLDNDGKLGWREDRALWGASRWQFVTIKVPANASKAQVMKAINALTFNSVGDVKTFSKLATAKRGGAYVFAWELGRGATPTTTGAWGPKHKTYQTFFARS